MKMVLMLANGFEEIEALGTADLLRRGGVEVTLCSINATCSVMGAHGISVTADCTLSAVIDETTDGIVLPGGMGGTTNLAANEQVINFIRALDEQGKWICAICAAPAVILAAHRLLQGRQATCYPAEPLTASLGDDYLPCTVHQDKNLITAAGPGSFAAFANAILTALKGEACADKVMQEALIALA